MEVYVDDMLVKSKEELAHLDDLSETFATFRQYQMKLNPSSIRKVLGVHGVPKGDRSKTREGQIRDEYEAKEERMRKYLRLTKHLTLEFDRVEFAQIPRSQNMIADEIVKLASSKEGLTSMDFEMEVQKHPSIEEVFTFAIQSTNNWMTPIISFLQDGHLPQDVEEARKVRKRVARFIILNDTLYKTGFSMPYLKCVNEEEAKYILEEIHEGVCRDHASPMSLVSKVIRTGYFWPTMQVDARKLVKKCDKCQRFGNVQCLPAERLTMITFLWPFAQWGIDIVGPLPRARTLTGETPFRLTYGTETVIPVEVGITSIRLETFHEESNDYQLKVNLDCLDETRDEAFDRWMKYQLKMAEYYNKMVKLRRLDKGYLILHKVTSATKDPAQGKLGLTWERLYRVVHYSRQDSYHLETLDGQRLPRPWNIEHLKKYH
ncbi:uncharacterized protein LOC142628836 [Castanea sativa]|uniref:uncharacterized protein LOC142628836 n=1 Tax=Castanea sativa TaxID=21020 RepID=UPI003F64D72B